MSTKSGEEAHEGMNHEHKMSECWLLDCDECGTTVWPDGDGYNEIEVEVRK